MNVWVDGGVGVRVSETVAFVDDTDHCLITLPLFYSVVVVVVVVVYKWMDGACRVPCIHAYAYITCLPCPVLLFCISVS